MGYARIRCACGRARGLGYGGNGGYGRERWRARWGRRDASRRAGVMGLRAPARGGVRLRYGACASRRAGVTGLRPRALARTLGTARRFAARNDERAACAALQLYQYIDVPLDCQSARRWYVPADGDALRSAVSADLRPRRQLPSVSPR